MTGAQNLDFVLEFFQKGLLAPNFAFWTTIFGRGKLLDKKIFLQFLTANFLEGGGWQLLLTLAFPFPGHDPIGDFTKTHSLVAVLAW